MTLYAMPHATGMPHIIKPGSEAVRKKVVVVWAGRHNTKTKTES